MTGRGQHGHYSLLICHCFDLKLSMPINNVNNFVTAINNIIPILILLMKTALYNEGEKP